MKYIDSEKLIASLNKTMQSYKSQMVDPRKYPIDHIDLMAFLAREYRAIIANVTSLQQEQLKDKQVVVITESHGDANIEWDCRSLDDVMALLKSAESFIAEKQIEKTSGPGSGPDYATTEGRLRNAHKFQQSEVDLEKEFQEYWYLHQYDHRLRRQVMDGHGKDVLENTARHFYELGLKARQ